MKVSLENLKPEYFFTLTTFRHAKLFANLDYVWQVLPKIEAYILSYPNKQIRTEIPQGAFIVNSETIEIGEGTIIEPGAYIKGPCILGKNCVVRHGAYIRGNFIAGDGCVIGHDTEVKNSLFLDGAHAAHFAYLGDTVLGNKVNLGAGTKCANLKLRDGVITIPSEEGRLSTGLRKMGAIIGDRTQIGCNAVTNPGSLIGKEVQCYPCVNMGGFVPTGSIVRNGHTPVIIPKRGSPSR